MGRVHQTPRSDHLDRLAASGLIYGKYPGVFWTRSFWKTEGVLKTVAEALGFGITQDYWNEEAAYKVTPSGMWQVESAAFEIHSMCLEAVDEVVKSDVLLEQFSIPVHLREAVRYSWSTAQSDLTGRLDLLWDGESPPKFCEYNADTPTVLVESAAAQRQWVRDVHPDKGQFNVLDEALVAAFDCLKAEDLNRHGRSHEFSLAFTAQRGNQPAVLDFVEERSTAKYMMEAAKVAQIPCSFIDLEEFEKPDMMNAVLQAGASKNSFAKSFAIWKLYPYEWLIDETLGRALQPPYLDGHLRWIEPPWKLILSSKAILPYLWKKHRNHPNLLPAFYSSHELHAAAAAATARTTTTSDSNHKSDPLLGTTSDFVGKPRFGREGVGIEYTNCEVSGFKSLREFSDAAEAAAKAPPPPTPPSPPHQGNTHQEEGVGSHLSESASWAVFKLWELAGGHHEAPTHHLLDHAYGSGARTEEVKENKAKKGSRGLSEHMHPERGEVRHHLGPPVYQQYHAPAVLHGRTVVTSAWVVRGAPAAACFREDNRTTTNNDSCFVPHFVDDEGDGNGSSSADGEFGALREFPLTDKQRELRTRLYGSDPVVPVVPESSQLGAPNGAYRNGGGVGYSPVVRTGWGSGGARTSTSTSSSSSSWFWSKNKSPGSGGSGGNHKPPPPHDSKKVPKAKVARGIPHKKWSPGRSTGSMGHAYSGRSSGGGRG